MGMLEIRDDSAWVKHIEGDAALCNRILSLDPRETIDLEVDGVVGKWEKMRTGKDGNRDNGHTVMAMITTGAGSHWASDIVIGNLNGTGLVHASLVRWKVFTLPNDLIVRKLGSLPPDTAKKAAAALRKTFGNT